MNTSKNALQGTHTDSGQNAHLQESARGESGGRSDLVKAWMTTPEATAARQTLKEALMESYNAGTIGADIVRRMFERYELAAL